MTETLRERVRLKLRERRLQPQRHAPTPLGSAPVTPPVYVKAHPVENWARLGYYAALHTAQSLRDGDFEFAAQALRQKPPHRSQLETAMRIAHRCGDVAAIQGDLESRSCLLRQDHHVTTVGFGVDTAPVFVGGGVVDRIGDELFHGIPRQRRHASAHAESTQEVLQLFEQGVAVERGHQLSRQARR